MQRLFLLLILCLSSIYVLGQAVRGTQYHPRGKGSRNITADGSRIRVDSLKAGKIRWLALSRDLLKLYPFGSRVHIQCEDYPELNGVWEVHDTMHSRHRNMVDFLCYPGRHRFGVVKCVLSLGPS